MLKGAIYAYTEKFTKIASNKCTEIFDEPFSFKISIVLY